MNDELTTLRLDMLMAQLILALAKTHNLPCDAGYAAIESTVLEHLQEMWIRHDQPIEGGNDETTYSTEPAATHNECMQCINDEHRKPGSSDK